MSKNIILTKKTKTATGTVQLTGSKSECNRALIIEALSKGKVKVQNVSDAAEAGTLQRGLSCVLRVSGSHQSDDSQLVTDNSQLVDIGPAGTAMRFLTAYLPLQNQEFTLTGTKRMQQRPIGILVDAMRKLGAH